MENNLFLAPGEGDAVVVKRQRQEGKSGDLKASGRVAHGAGRDAIADDDVAPELLVRRNGGNSQLKIFAGTIAWARL